LICQYIYYDVVTNVTPRHEAGNDGTGRPGRLPPNFTVAGTAVNTRAGSTVDNITQAVEEQSKFTSFTGVTAHKIKGISAEFWPYVTVLLREMDGLCKQNTYQYGPSKGKPMQFAMTSGWRNIETSMRLQEQSGREPNREQAAKSAHVKGFAIDLSVRGAGEGNLGSMPFFNEPDPITSTTSLTREISTGQIDKSSVSRFRYAIYTLSKETNTVETNFDALVEKIRNKPTLLETAFGSAEGLDTHANYLRNARDFFIKVYGAAVVIANASPDNGGISGNWGGNWRKRCPLFNSLGLGPDPVHVEDSDYRNKAGTNIDAGPPPAVVAALKEGESREQLKSFKFRPNIWFCPPPVCNVIYPHMYESMSVSRQMMRETTRLQLDAFNQFYESVMLSTYYYAPKFPEGNHVFGSGMGSVTKTVLMDHEVFSGIIPKMERISEISFYAKSSGTAGDLRAESAPVDSSEAGVTIVGYGDKVAHFNLLTHRYSARTGSVNGPFNPYLVNGFPAVVLNEVSGRSSTERDAVKTIIDGKRDPHTSSKNHWIGMITSLDHTFNQGGARTSVGLSYVRSHRTGDDTDDLLSESVTDQGGFVVQDPNFKPVGVASTVSHDFSSGAVSLSYADALVAVGHSDERSDTAWIFALFMKTVGARFAEILGEATLTHKSLDPVAQERYAIDAGEPTAYEAIEARPSDFSPNAAALASIPSTFKGPNGEKIESAKWSGAPTVVVLSYVADVPCATVGELVRFPGEPGPGSGQLGAISLSSWLSKSFRFGDKASAVKEDPKLVAFLDFSYPNLVNVPPIRYSTASIAIKLPGSTLTVSLAPAASSVSYDRSLPVEEAIRPPWIDKNTYSAQKSDVEGLTKLDLHYAHLFGSPSIISTLLREGATPYDGMDIHSVEQAVDYLVADAGTRSAEEDSVLNSYTTALTTRPIATLQDVLAPKGYLPETKQGQRVWKLDESLKSSVDLQVSGGFHSNAVTGLRFSKGGESKVEGLSDINELEYGSALEFLDLVGTASPLGSRLSPGQADSISSADAVRADPRAPRAKRVKRYLDEINGSSSLRQVPDGVTFIKTPPGVGREG